MLTTALLSLALLLSYAFVLDGENTLNEMKSLVLCKSGTNGVDITEAERIETSFTAWCETNGEQDASFVCWSEVENQGIGRPDLSRRAQADVVIAYGDASLLTHDKRGLQPANVDQCCLSESASVELFGTLDTVGLQLEYGGNTYTIWSVIDCEEPILLLLAEGGAAAEASGGSDPEAVVAARTAAGNQSNDIGVSESLVKAINGVSGVVFNYAVVSGSDVCAQQFVSLFSSSETEGLDYEAYRSFGVACVALVPLLLVLILTAYAIRFILSYRSRPLLCLLLGLGSVIYVAIFCFVCGSAFSHLPLVPPNRWFDAMMNWLNFAHMIVLGSKPLVELPYWISSARCALGLIGAVMAILLLVARQAFDKRCLYAPENNAIQTTRCVLIEAIVVAAVEVVVVFVAGYVGLSLMHWQLMTFMLPSFLLGARLSHFRYVDGE